MRKMRQFQVNLILVILNFALTPCSNSDCAKLQYHHLTNCTGTTGTDHILLNENNVLLSECVVKCEVAFQCMLIFYNAVTKTCTLHSRMLTEITLALDGDSKCFVADDVVEEWISGIASVPNVHPNSSGSALTGPPDSICWYASEVNKIRNVQVQFPREMYIWKVCIYEEISPGGLSGIKLRTPSGTWHKIWGQVPQYLSESRIFCPDLEVTMYKTATIQIDIGMRSVHEYIDAVMVFGKKNRLPMSGNT